MFPVVKHLKPTGTDAMQLVQHAQALIQQGERQTETLNQTVSSVCQLKILTMNVYVLIDCTWGHHAVTHFSCINIIKHVPEHVIHFCTFEADQLLIVCLRTSQRCLWVGQPGPGSVQQRMWRSARGRVPVPASPRTAQLQLGRICRCKYKYHLISAMTSYMKT